MSLLITLSGQKEPRKRQWRAWSPEGRWQFCAELLHGFIFLPFLISPKSSDLSFSPGFLSASALKLTLFFKFRFLKRSYKMYMYCNLFLVYCYLLILAWFLVWFAEAPTWGFGCFVFRLVLCCFRAFLHCFSSLAFLGIISFFSWFDFELFCWLITSMHSWIWLWGFYVVERAWQIG